MADVPGKFYRATKVRTGVAPSSAGSIEGEVLPPVNPPGSSLNSVGLTMPSAFIVSNSPLTSNGTIGVAGAGTVAQYIRGDGSLADFPESSGGGSSVSYYLNGSVDQGTIGGIAYKELSKVPILGAGTDFSINADGYIASFITDAGDPSLLEIPGGNWNFETYFSASSSGGTPTFYVELYKVSSGGTATLIASSSSSPELIAFGTNLNPYFSSLAVPTTTLALTDRLAVRYYVTHSGRTITLHTENNHLCQIITTFTTGLTALNGLTAQVQNFAVGTTGTDFNIASATATHTFNLPTASATNRGALSSADWSLFTQAYNDKINSAAVTGTTTKTLTLTQQDGGTITASWSDLNTDAVLSVFGRTGAVVAANGDYTTAQVTESGNLYYTDARSRAALSFAAGSGAYNTSTGVITIPTNNNQITNGAGYITSAALAGYLPLTGGTLTGPLGGTSASFSSSIAAYSGNIQLESVATNNSWIANNFYYDGSFKYKANGFATALYFDGFEFEIRTAISGTANSIVTWLTPFRIDNASGATTITSLSGSGTRMVVSDSNGVLSTQAIPLGTVTSVTASSPLASSGGTTPNITIQQASGSQSGFLSSTDWTTFNNKQNALTNPVTGTGTTNYLPKFTGASTIGNSALQEISGNLGLGVTPNNWTGTGVKAFQFQNGSIAASLTFGALFGWNTYYDGSYRYVSNSSASAFLAAGNDFIWYQAPSGTAGNAISFTQAMTLDSSGRLGVGTGSSSLNNHITFTQTIGGSPANLSELEPFATVKIKGRPDRNNIVYIGALDALTGMIIQSGTTTTAAPLAIQPFGGNLLVGTTSDNGARLQVSGTATFGTTSNGGNVNAFVSSYGNNGLFQSFGTDGALKLQMGGLGTNEAFFYTGPSNFMTFYSGGTERMRITSGGNVGIGTPSPQDRLDVNGSIRFRANTPNFTSVLENGVIDYVSTSIFPTTPTVRIASIGTASVGGQIRFLTGTSSSLDTRMTIDSSGNVGIGTPSPSTFLHVLGANTTDRGQLSIQSNNVSNAAKVTWYYHTTNQGEIGTTSGDFYALAVNNFLFYAGGSPRMTITSGGNVLIGTTTDNGQKFQVSGNATFSGVLTTGNWEAYTYAVNNAWLAENVVFDGAFKRRSTGFAIALYSDAGSGFQVRMAGSSVAGSTISWTNALALNGSSFAATFISSVTATSFFESSDATLKTLIADNYQVKGIDSVVAKLYIKNGKEELGYFAQDLQGVLPSAVSKGSDGLLNLSYREVHTAKIAYLEEKIKQLEKKYEIN